MDVKMPSRRVIFIISLLEICCYILIALKIDSTGKVPGLPVGNTNAKIPAYRPNKVAMFESYSSQQYGFEKNDIVRKFHINNNGSDVLVLLRIQKTGSRSMSKYLRRYIDVSTYCNCSGAESKCPCYQNWMRNVLMMYYKQFPCGLHADWTVLHTCAEWYINQRHHKKIRQRHLYATMVREPFIRFLSEWLHVKRGATWKEVPLQCGGTSATEAEIPPCYKTLNWEGVSLNDFMNCSSNLAINRQTRMLADLMRVKCYNESGMSYEDRHNTMLKSAQDNLKSMAYFGLTGHQEVSQIMFENTFNLSFRTKFNTYLQKAQSSSVNVTEETKKHLLYLNRFDVMLFKFAKTLFHERVLHLIGTTKDIQLKRRLQTLVKKLVT